VTNGRTDRCRDRTASVTDGVTLNFFLKKVMTFLLIVLRSDHLFSRPRHSHPLSAFQLIVSPVFLVASAAKKTRLSSGCHPSLCMVSPGAPPLLTPLDRCIPARLKYQTNSPSLRVLDAAVTRIYAPKLPFHFRRKKTRNIFLGREIEKLTFFQTPFSTLIHPESETASAPVAEILATPTMAEISE